MQISYHFGQCAATSGDSQTTLARVLWKTGILGIGRDHVGLGAVGG